MTMTARETADSLAEMTGAFERRRDAILAALLAERKATLAEAATNIRKWLDRNHASLHAGEFSAQEWRTLRAVLGAVLLETVALSPEGKGPTDHTPEEET